VNWQEFPIAMHRGAGAPHVPPTHVPEQHWSSFEQLAPFPRFPVQLGGGIAAAHWYEPPAPAGRQLVPAQQLVSPAPEHGAASGVQAEHRRIPAPSEAHGPPAQHCCGYWHSPPS
jgi:hypothetical protein